MTKGLAKSRLKHVLKMNTELCKEIVYNLPLEMGSGSDVQKNNFKMIQLTASSIIYLAKSGHASLFYINFQILKIPDISK